MKKISIALSMSVVIWTLSGCSNKDIESLQNEKAQLTNELVELQKRISEKDEEITLLKENVSELTTKRSELTTSVKMVRWSSIARNENDAFYDLPNLYRIHSEHVLIDDWYVIKDNYFQIELVGYEDAKKVDFYTVRLESDEGEILVFTDTEPSDGWVYTNETIGDIINKQMESGPNRFSFEPYFLLYTEVTLKNGSVIKTPNVPIYNK